MIVFHDPRCVEYVRVGHPERPVESLEAWPSCATVTQIGHGNAQRLPRSPPARARSSAHVHAVEEDFADFDPNTPAYPKICKYAARTRSAAAEIAPGLSDSAQAVADLCLLALYIVVLAVK